MFNHYRDSRTSDRFQTFFRHQFFFHKKCIIKKFLYFQSCRATATTKLNLVPEYNSEDDSDDDSSKPSQKPLFPSSSNNSYPTNKQAIKSIEIPTGQSTEKTQPESQQPNSPKKVDAHKEKPSFASIITGGRSPQHETVDIKLYTGQDEPDETSNQVDEKIDETELVPQKTFQRKRRIEFSASRTHVKRVNRSEETSTDSTKDATASIADLKNTYSNFQKGDIEFMEKPASNGSEDTDDKKDTECDKLKDEQQLLEAKLNFLCQGRSDVSPVQIIQIQLQVSAYYVSNLIEKMFNKTLGNRAPHRN